MPDWDPWYGAAIGIVGMVVVPIAIHLRNLSFKKTDKGLHEVRAWCPHSFIDIVSEGILVNATFISPPGQLHYTCERCGMSLANEQFAERLVYKPQGNNAREMVDDYIRREKRFEKAIKKYRG